jgi:phosphohistidine phosphatase
MQLYLIRHAIASDEPDGPSPDGLPEDLDPMDAARPLTSRGARRFSDATRGLGRLGVRFDRILHSPLLRAVETAEILEDLLRGESISTPLLARSPELELLTRLEGEAVAVVGHQPWLGELLGLLSLGTPEAGRVFTWKKGGVAWLEGDPAPAGMQLRAFWTPRSLRTMR